MINQNFEKILEQAIKKEATDIHLNLEKAPHFRINGSLSHLNGFNKLSKEEIEEMAFSMMTEERKEQFLCQRDVDLSFDYKGKARFRVSVYKQMGKLSVAMRLIPNDIKTIEELHLPEICHQFARYQQGFF